MESSDPRLLLISPDDNVYVVIQPLTEGESVMLNGTEARVTKSLPMGHKIAVRDIRAGEKVLKYGVPIGTATENIKAGGHVHTHNLKSDYIGWTPRIGG